MEVSGLLDVIISLEVISYRLHSINNYGPLPSHPAIKTSWNLNSIGYCNYLENMFQFLLKFLYSWIVSHRKTGTVARNT